MEDDVPKEEKKRRHTLLEELQAQVVAEINRRFLGQTVQVLVEEKHKGKWRGRIPQNKLVFLEDDTRDLRGQLVEVEVIWTGPYSMQGRLPGQAVTPIAADTILVDDYAGDVIPLMAS
jgi:tRNA-2-methylthio-N6-dimethylallyladenosine synthase